MAPIIGLYLALVSILASLSTSELLLDVQPSVISPEITPQLVVYCTVTNNQVQHLDDVKTVTLSIYNETLRKFEDLFVLDSSTLNLKNLMPIKYSQISFGNLYIILTLNNPTEFDAKVYRCSVNGDNSNVTNISLFAKKAVEYETNSTALLEKIRHFKTVEVKSKCFLRNNDKTDNGLLKTTNQDQGSKVYFFADSEIIKERIEPVILKCSFHALKEDQNETFTLQSLYILHESNGVIANVSKGQPVVTVFQGGNSKTIQGEIYDNETEDSYLQVTWNNLRFTDSGKYFCEANVKHSDGRAERLSEMLILTVVSPTFDDLVEVVEKLLVQVDEDNLRIRENKQTIKDLKEKNIISIEEDVLLNNQSIQSLKDDMNSNQQNIIRVKKDVLLNNQSIQSLKDDMNSNQQNIIRVKKDVLLNNQSIQSLKDDMNSNQQNIIRIKEDLQFHQQNMTDLRENLEIIFSNFSNTLIELKYQIDKERTGDKDISSCRDVKSREDRPVVVLASGLKVMCDTKTDGGGWIIFQRRIIGTVDFYRGWKEYRDGFGDFNIGEFYLGNENIYNLTSTGIYDLRIDMKHNTNFYHAQYADFQILKEKDNYKLKIGTYSGNAGDSLSYHNNMYFSTFDKDNDLSGSNCASQYTGAWWFNDCHNSNLNAKWGSFESYKGVMWYALTSYAASSSFTEMKIRKRRYVL